MSVSVSEKQDSPRLLLPSQPTNSIPTGPGVPSSHPDQVHIGMRDLCDDPTLVCRWPLKPPGTFTPTSCRSIVAVEIFTGDSASSSVRTT